MSRKRNLHEFNKFDVVGSILNQQHRSQVTKKKNLQDPKFVYEKSEKQIPRFTDPPAFVEKDILKTNDVSRSLYSGDEAKSYPFIFALMKSKEIITVSTLSQLNLFEITTKSEETLVKQLLKSLCDSLQEHRLSGFPEEVVSALRQRKNINADDEIPHSESKGIL